MAYALEHHVPHVAFGYPAASADAGAGDGQFLRTHLRGGQFRLAAEDVKRAGAQVRQAVVGADHFRSVERVRQGAVLVGVGAAVEDRLTGRVLAVEIRP